MAGTSRVGPSIMRVRVEAPANLHPVALAQAIVGDSILLKAEPTWKARPLDKWRPLDEQYTRLLTLYEKHIKAIVQAFEDELGTEHFEKAKRKKKKAVRKRVKSAPLLSADQMQRLAKLIADHHTAIVIEMGAKSAVSKSEIRRLIRLKILPPEAMDVVKDSYLFGQLVGSVRDITAREKLHELDYTDFRARIARQPVPLTDHEERALEWAKHSAAIHVTALGNVISDGAKKLVIRHDGELRQKMFTTIQTEVKANITRRETVRKLASELGHATQDWGRDFGRVAATEKQQAFQEGLAHSLVKHEGDPKTVLVAKMPKPDACPDCVAAYLTAGHGSRPRIFKLSELMENGTNVGKKRPAWNPVVGTMHPWCQCELIHIPPGFSFEKKPPKGYEATDEGGWVRESDGKPWSPRLMPEEMVRSLDPDLLKAAFMSYPNVPEEGCAVRVSDPSVAAVCDAVIAATPPWMFHKDVGVTLITTDISRVGTALDEHDLAYWTANEIRLAQTLPAEKVERVLKHELGHALNVYLVNKMGDEDKVRAWHQRLYDVAMDEGFVSKYAKSLPIENAAEVTRMYLYEKKLLMLHYSRQFAIVYRSYRGAEKAHETGREGTSQ